MLIKGFYLTKKALCSIIVLQLLCGCANIVPPPIQELRDEYDHKRLFVPHIFLMDLETVSTNHLQESRWDFTDSITKLFLSELNDLAVPFEFNNPLENRWSDSLWIRDSINFRYSTVRGLDRNYVLSTVPYSESPQFIPVLLYRHVHKSDHYNRRHFANIQLWVFIVEKGEIIYLKRSEESTDKVYYIHRHELDKSKISTRRIWQRVVNDAMNDYFKNLKQ